MKVLLLCRFAARGKITGEEDGWALRSVLTQWRRRASLLWPGIEPGFIIPSLRQVAIHADICLLSARFTIILP
jgi:hypothetical protein